MPHKIIKLKSPSKINLALWIKEKRPDGYHEIETIFYENENLYDEIEIEFTKSNSLSVEISFIQDKLNKLISKNENLAYKAALLFFEKLNVKGICRIKINKNIPLEAGLGGGSSNAAGVLKGLNQIFSYQLDESKLLILSETLGSDVPFFMYGGTCLGKGKGEHLIKLENKLDLEIEIKKLPEISVSTKWAYEQMDSRGIAAEHSLQIRNLVNAMKIKDYNLFSQNTFNDFETAVFSHHPQLIDLRKNFLNEGYTISGLCGSGAAVFGMRCRDKVTSPLYLI
ncbi:MAG: 4-(cytidine 5'-diphospho)-2-C-methyl-D-erythritol kinase [Candidatus Melainabacteria bacterium RIFCSPLOWO2_02_FULL_35_15]|nr:MAG: 4-(cytidine 5'-diphospho)-2-C-methyl-D-erythritol kinase [Candidatus Melainabacteria bacterium RIFCSPLOWO2_02_FULL_35_15]